MGQIASPARKRRRGRVTTPDARRERRSEGRVLGVVTSSDVTRTFRADLLRHQIHQGFTKNIAFHVHPGC